MKFHQPLADIFVPSGIAVEKALERTTHLGIGAHQDDLEFMCLHGILECFQQQDRWFSGVIVTDGQGSSRTDSYAKCTNAEMQRIRAEEQKKAASLGEYSSVVLLNYSSAAIKKPCPRDVIEDIKNLILKTKPTIIYTHNPADKHDTHIAVFLSVIQALREIPKELHPTAIYGCEVWRSLDWMLDHDKKVFDVSKNEKLSVELMKVFDSQISGGKKYDVATLGRKRSNATYFDSHSIDHSTLSEYAMDLTPLIQDPSLDVVEYVQSFIVRFNQDVKTKINKFL
jgi:LmbE family N-acetylglucosaminyl deacetylase